MIYSDNKDFYPTPRELFYQLMNGSRYISGRVLEPSAGKGDLINHIRDWLPSEEELKTNPKAREYVVKEFGEDVMKVKLLEASE